jgi:hypothetical protein
VTADPVWFGPDRRPLFGWMHRPERGWARSGVVLCPPVGDEERRTYLTYRKLAESLAASGIASIRFAYDGTGDSAGSFDDPDRVAAWTSSIVEGIEVMRAAGARHVALVGMRLGATLATQAVRSVDRPVDAVILWDPCVTGREFLRQQQILLSTIEARPEIGEEQPPVGSEGGKGVETPGYRFPSALAGDLRRLEIAPVEAPQTRVLVLERPDRAASGRLDRYLGDDSADRITAVGQGDLLDVPPPSAVVPWQSIWDITTWLSDLAGPEEAPITVPDAREAVVATDDRDRPICERALRLGDIGLFAITTEPDDPGPRPWVMFLNVATEHHIGPGRLWVDLARQWARHGVRSVRFDVSGVGDSPVHSGQRENVQYASEWLGDIPELACGVSPDDPSNTVLIGLCSGGYGALESGMATGARSVYAINPSLSAPDMGRSTQHHGGRRRASRSLPTPLAKLARKHGRTAWWLWRRYRQLAVWQAPMAVPALAVRSGLDVHLICGVDELKPFRRVLYWRLFGERRLTRTGRFELAVIPSMDHSLLFGHGRDAVARLLSERVLGHRGSVAPPPRLDDGNWAAVWSRSAAVPILG